jgi:hypothetical protein
LAKPDAPLLAPFPALLETAYTIAAFPAIIIQF